MNRRTSFITLSLLAGTALAVPLVSGEALSQTTQTTPSTEHTPSTPGDQNKPSDQKKPSEQKSNDQNKPSGQKKPSDQTQPSNQNAPGPTPTAQDTRGGSQSINVTSSDFTNGGAIPAKYTCEGGGKPPALEWSGLPGGTKSLALVVDDPDTAQGTYVHWIVYDIAPNTMSLAGGATVPSGAKLGKNSKGQTGWTAPCPPSGMHHYRFKVYALSDMLNLDKPTQEELTNAMKGKLLGQGELMGTVAHEAGGKK